MQLVVLLVLGMTLYFAVSPMMAESLLLGGLIAVLAQAYFSWRVFRHTGAQAAQRIARDSYAGAVGKFFLAVAGFALVFAFYKPLVAWAVFAGYSMMVVIQVAGSWLLVRQAASHNRTKS
jgi:ATP synthase protein I